MGDPGKVRNLYRGKKNKQDTRDKMDRWAVSGLFSCTHTVLTPCVVSCIRSGRRGSRWVLVFELDLASHCGEQIDTVIDVVNLGTLINTQVYYCVSPTPKRP